MAVGTLTPPTGTQTGSFNVIVALDTAVTDFTADNVAMTAVSGNGITGITFTITPGEGMGHNLFFNLPEDVVGSFRIELTGQVTPEGTSTPEALTSNAVTVVYDNFSEVSVVFGSVEYRAGGVVAVPVTFGENVVAPSKTIFQASRLTGDNLSGIAYALVGEDASYELIFDIPTGRKGTFRLSGDGYVLKSSGIRDNINVSAITIIYNMKSPKFVFELPSVLNRGRNDLFYDFEELVWKLDSTKIEVDGISVEPTIYRAVATDARPAAPAVLGSDWELAVDGHTEHARYYLFRFSMPEDQLPGGLNVVFDDGAFETVPSVV